MKRSARTNGIHNGDDEVRVDSRGNDDDDEVREHLR